MPPPMVRPTSLFQDPAVVRAFQQAGGSLPGLPEPGADQGSAQPTCRKWRVHDAREGLLRVPCLLRMKSLAVSAKLILPKRRLSKHPRFRALTASPGACPSDTFPAQPVDSSARVTAVKRGRIRRSSAAGFLAKRRQVASLVYQILQFGGSCRGGRARGGQRQAAGKERLMSLSARSPPNGPAAWPREPEPPGRGVLNRSCRVARGIQ